MRKVYIPLLLTALSTLGAAAQSKFDAPGQLYLNYYQTLRENPAARLAPIANAPFDLTAVSRGEVQAEAFFTLNPGADVSAIARDLNVELEIGDVIIVSGSLEDIVAASNSEMVKSASFPQVMRPMMDKARRAIGADDVHNGESLSKAYTGSGVIAGIFDNGLDANHANFIADNGAGANRIKKLWYFTGNNGNFTEYTSADISSFTTDQADGTHGTHTLGIMAGSYKGRGGKISVYDPEKDYYTVSSRRFDNPYYGVAPDADIAAGCGSLSTPNILKGVQQIAQYAKAEGKPAVINLSIGHIVGPHDGSSDFSRAMNEVGKDVILCMASGNDGEYGITLSKTLSSSDTKLATFLTPVSSRGSGTLDIWGSNSDIYTVKFQIYDLTQKTALYEYTIDKAGTYAVATSNYQGTHDTNIDKALQSSMFTITFSQNANNNRYNCYIGYSLNTNTSSNKDGNLVVGIVIEGKNGQRIDVVNDCSDDYGQPTVNMESKGIAGYSDGTPDFTISDMACIDNAIVVGSWTSRDEWVSVNNYVGGYYLNDGSIYYPEDDISSFTSYGTLINGTSLPHICAPGAGIVSSYSEYYCQSIGLNETNTANLLADITVNSRSNRWVVEQGTSMACPMVAGGIALMLEQDATLDIDKVKRFIIANAKTDSYTKAGHPIQWGAGKFDLLSTMKSLEAGGVNDVIASDEDRLAISANGSNGWDIYVPNAQSLKIDLYNISGRLVKSVNAEGNSATLSTEGIAKGVYVVNVNGSHSERILVK